MVFNSITTVKNPTPLYQITPVRTPGDLEATTMLFRAYSQSLNLDLSFQSFEREISDMPGLYAISAGGELLLARNTTTNEPVGCVALRCLSAIAATGGGGEDEEEISSIPQGMQPDDGEAASDFVNGIEIKRLYTTPAARGSGLGSRLATQIVHVAHQLGYDEIKLDTLPSMVAAQNLYTRLGFVDIIPYCFNPVSGARFLGLKLNKEVT